MVASGGTAIAALIWPSWWRRVAVAVDFTVEFRCASEPRRSEGVVPLLLHNQCPTPATNHSTRTHIPSAATNLLVSAG
jgi:hypothetical protein